jgi:hypothetical protein
MGPGLPRAHSYNSIATRTHTVHSHGTRVRRSVSSRTAQATPLHDARSEASKLRSSKSSRSQARTPRFFSAYCTDAESPQGCTRRYSDRAHCSRRCASALGIFSGRNHARGLTFKIFFLCDHLRRRSHLSHRQCCIAIIWNVQRLRIDGISTTGCETQSERRGRGFRARAKMGSLRCRRT